MIIYRKNEIILNINAFLFNKCLSSSDFINKKDTFTAMSEDIFLLF